MSRLIIDAWWVVIGICLIRDVLVTIIHLLPVPPGYELHKSIFEPIKPAPLLWLTVFLLWTHMRVGF